ncbi:DUF6434 domain-containing protein [Kiloniella majae]|uniref:DUF6434 domain-containing protein n=1 Tax=Kiloniella majae TaxID=1938558 RepID=UPI001C3F86CC|nr:DUF6434 domain-containing protein [Kiloniella majae]
MKKTQEILPQNTTLNIDWHSAVLTRETPITKNYKHTQNVRRFMKSECGDLFKFNRAFMSWIKNGEPKTLGDVADHWLAQNAS